MIEENRTQRPLVVGTSLVILVLAARLLYLVDSSLREGQGIGLTGEGAIETVPILLLLALLIWMLARSKGEAPFDTGRGDTQVIGIMLGMFLIGIYIGPGLSISLDSELVGLIFLAIPILLIAAILLPGTDDSIVTKQEEE